MKLLKFLLIISLISTAYAQTTKFDLTTQVKNQLPIVNGGTNANNASTAPVLDTTNYNLGQWWANLSSNSVATISYYCSTDVGTATILVQASSGGLSQSLDCSVSGTATPAGGSNIISSGAYILESVTAITSAHRITFILRYQ